MEFWNKMYAPINPLIIKGPIVEKMPNDVVEESWASEYISCTKNFAV